MCILATITTTTTATTDAAATTTTSNHHHQLHFYPPPPPRVVLTPRASSLLQIRDESVKSAAEADRLRAKLEAASASQDSGGGSGDIASASFVEAERALDATRRELKSLKGDNRRLQKIVRERLVADAMRCADRDAAVETLKEEVR
jgi:hypothetical protein